MLKLTLKSTVKSSIIAMATFASISSAFAADEIFNGQENLTDVISTVDIFAPNVGESVDVDGSAFGDNFVIQSTNGELILNNAQLSQTDNIISTVNIDVEATPLVDVKSDAIANRAIVVSRGNGGNVINSAQTSTAAVGDPWMGMTGWAGMAPGEGGGLTVQEAADAFARGEECWCNGDPLSDVNINVGTVDNLNVASNAMGNMGQFLLEGTNNVVNSVQANSVMNQSLIDVNATAITSKLDITSVASGNSLTLVLGELPTEQAAATPE